MCAEKIQRFLMATVLTLSMLLFAIGEMQYAFTLQSFVIVMVLAWAFTDFCPSIWFFRKFFGTCKS